MLQSGDVFLHGQVGEKGLSFRRTHHGRMSHVMEIDVAIDSARRRLYNHPQDHVFQKRASLGLEKHLRIGIHICAIYLSFVGFLPFAILVSSISQGMSSDISALAKFGPLLLMLLLGLVVFSVSVRLWRLWELGRTLSIVLLLLHLLFGYSLIRNRSTDSAQLIIAIAMCFFAVVGLVFLTRPKVKALFQVDSDVGG
jgi:hypothetical protein